MNPIVAYWKKLSVRTRDIIVSLGFPLVAILLVLSGIAAFVEFKKSPPYVDTEKYPIRGIDISRHNGMMNLDAARADGYEFAFIKASEGTSYHDENFRLNYDKARQAGMKVGAYHFFRFDCDGVRQATNLLRAVGPRFLDMGLAIDVEEAGNPPGISPALVAERLQKMVEYLNLMGYRVILYSNVKGYYNIVKPADTAGMLWICSFNRTPINEDWTFWQYYHHGKVKGISGDVDLNAFGGSREEWNEFLKSQQYIPRKDVK